MRSYIPIHIYYFLQPQAKWTKILPAHCTAATSNNSNNKQENHKHLQCKNVWKIVQINRGDTGLVENLDVHVWRSPTWQVKLPAFVKENCLVTKAILKSGQCNGTYSFRWQRQYPKSLGTELNRRKTTSQLGSLYIFMSQSSSPEEFNSSQRATSLLSCCFTFFTERGILVATDAINYQFN